MTQAERAGQAQQESLDAYPYVASGHTVAGDSAAAINQQTAAQAIADAKAAVAVHKANPNGYTILGRNPLLPQPRNPLQPVGVAA